MICLSECDWCQEVNLFEQGTEPLCHKCGHRADQARADCECPPCAAGRSQWFAELDASLPLLKLVR